MAYSLLYSELHGGAAWGCDYAASKGEVHMHEQEQRLTNTCIRCNNFNATQQLIYALTHAQVRMQTHFHRSV